MTAIRFVVDVKTKGSNAREHPMARAGRVNRERDALAAKWRALLANGVPELLVPASIHRVPRGIPAKDKAAAKAAGVDLRRMEPITKPAAPLVVKLTRISIGTLDEFENLPHALKGIVDEICRQCGVDDRPGGPIRFKAAQEKPPKLPKGVKRPKGWGQVRVEIEADAERRPVRVTG